MNYKGDGSDLGYYFNTKWHLQDGVTVLDLSKMDDEIGYYVMLASPKVANSEAEWRAHKFPRATHYISLENESDQIRYSKTAAKLIAYTALNSKLNEMTRSKFTALLGIVSPTTKLSPEATVNRLAEYIEYSTPANQHIEKFNNLVDMLSTAEGKIRFDVMFLIEQAKYIRAIYSKQDIWSWIRSNGTTITIGDRYSEAVDFFMHPKKKDELDELQAQIKEKM